MRSDTVVRPAIDRWLPFGVAAVSAAVFLLASRHLVDDVYVTLSYARNLALHGHWGLVEQGMANTATSPLHVAAVAAVTVGVRDAVVGAGVVFVAAQVLLATGLNRLAEKTGLPRQFVLLAFTALLLNPLLVSAVGLEVLPAAAGAVWVLVFATERRPAALGFAAGALILVRVDLLVVALVVFVARPRFWDGVWRTTFAALVVAVPWFAFSWFVLGSAVPDTVVFQQPTVPWLDFPAATLISFLPVPLSAIVALVRRDEASRPFAVLAGAGIVHSVVVASPDPWSYAPAIVGATVFLAAWICVTPHRIPAAAAAGLALAAAVGVYVAPGLPRRFAPITGNLAATDEYREIGTQLAMLAKGRAVKSPGEAGALAYACDCHLVGEFSDRGAVDPAITETKLHSTELGRALIEANVHHFDHGVAPTTPDLVLETTPRAPPPTALAAWTIDSPRAGTQHLYLAPARRQ
ncbi:hypothetical protein [Amycolatopsis sp. NPDC051372]|uniref:hypothetical protein n=1 Tax=Amycolatopsis sp. NPDC051372 TaxID=3155669 RepID=UPI00344449D8